MVYHDNLSHLNQAFFFRLITRANASMNHQVNSVPTNAETKAGLQDANDWIPYFLASIAALSSISPYLQDISMSLYPFFSHGFHRLTRATHRARLAGAKVGMVIAAVAASFGFHPGLDQTIFMAPRLPWGPGRPGLALGFGEVGWRWWNKKNMVLQKKTMIGEHENVGTWSGHHILKKGIVGRYRKIKENMGRHILWDLDSGGVLGINDDFYSKKSIQASNMRIEL